MGRRVFDSKPFACFSEASAISRRRALYEASNPFKNTSGVPGVTLVE